MNKAPIFAFLSDLRANNSKDWMDENRNRYQQAKRIWLEEIQRMLDRLAQHDPAFDLLEPKSLLSRINNNRRFQPDKPVYKDFFTCSFLGGMGAAAFHLSVSPGNSWIGIGIHRPDKERLGHLRHSIDMEGEKWEAALKDPDFLAYYGGLDEDPQALKKSPKGYAVDHPHIELLRRKNFTSLHPLKDEVVLADSFVDEIETAFLKGSKVLDWMTSVLRTSGTSV